MNPNTNIVYHGSISKYALNLHKIDLTRCQNYSDFGKGFYVTANILQAYTHAEKKARDYNNEHKIKVYPIIAVYYIKVDKIKKLNYHNIRNHDIKWAEFVYNNRLGYKYLLSDYHNLDNKFDVVYGDLADGWMGTLIDDAKSGIITLEEFHREIKPYNKEYHQMSFHTKEAIKQLEYKCIKIGGNIL